ncbi:MAG: hypothetical protein NXH74_11175 [Rhodobacteraceae bacterium]|nr:hypothetical protein [Paracoccaceae bacterium]
MVLIVPDPVPTGLTTSIDSLERQLADMRAELEGMYARIKAGEFGELKNAMKATSEIRQWLKIAIEAEAQLATRKKSDKGIVHDYGLDLDAARDSIECRLARLRRNRDAGRVS